MEQENVQNTISNGVVEPKVKKSRTKFIVGGFIVLVAIATGLFFGYKRVSNNPVAIYKNAVNDCYQFLSKNIEEANKEIWDFDFTKDPIDIRLNGKLTSDLEELKPFTGLDYHFNVGFDYQKELANVGIQVSKDNTVLNLLLSFINKKGYIKSEALFDKVIDGGEVDIFSEIKSDELTSLQDFHLNYDDINYILKAYKNVLIDSLVQDHLTMKDDTITIDGKEYKGKTITYHVDQEVVKKMIDIFVDQTVNDDKLLGILSDISDSSKEEIKKSLNALKEEDYSEFVAVDVVMHTDKSNHIISGSMKPDKNSSLEFTSIDDKVSITINDSQNALKMNILDNKASMEFYQNESKALSLDIIENDDSVKAAFTVDQNGVKINGEAELKNIKMEKEKMSADILFNINVKAIGQDINLGFDGSYAIEKKELEKIDVSNAVSVDSLTEADAEKLLTNLSDIIGKLGLTDILNYFM